MRNQAGGKKYKSNKKLVTTGKKDLILKDDTEAYGIVERNLGGAHFQVRILNKDDPGSNETILSTLRGTMRRRKSTNFVKKDSVVLLSLREYETTKADILNVYSEFQVISLIRKGEIPPLQEYSLDHDDDDEADDIPDPSQKEIKSYSDIYTDLDDPEENVNKDKIDLNDI